MKYPIRTALVLTTIARLGAQPGVFLKTPGNAVKQSESTIRATEVNKRRTAGSWHMLLVFRDIPTTVEVEQLNQRNIQTLQFVPERGLLSVVADLTPLEGLDLEWSGRLRSEQKISPMLALAEWGPGEGERNILVEFHQDVNRADAVGIVFEEGLSIVDHPDLLGYQLLVRGSPAKLAALASWDEVAYLFPANTAMVEGRTLEPCGGALTAAGPIGQIVAKIGEGWDGAGKGSADLGYYFSSFTGRLTPEQARGEFLKVAAEWGKYVKVKFTQAAAGDSRRTVNVLFGTGNHGDGYSFDGPGKTLAHTFYPSPPNPEPIAGDLHLDDDESWQIGTNTDLFSVMLHEMGHALGLGHSDNPAAVMYPYYRKVTELQADDIGAIQELYAIQDGQTPVNPSVPAPLELSISQPGAAAFNTQADQMSLGGTTAGGTGAIQVTWSSSSGGSGVASGSRPWSVPSVALRMGDNVITVIAIDSAQGRVSRQVRVTRDVPPSQAPLAVKIMVPTAGASYLTGEQTITLSGTAGPDGQVNRVFWANSRGSGGSVVGTMNWTTSAVPLESGMNRITVTVVSALGSIASATLDVEYRPGAPAPGGPDTVAPGLTILDPGQTTIVTAQASITISGIASDNVRVTEVNYLTSSGRNGTAQGTTSWRIADLPLLLGVNTIVIRAWDATGNMSWRSLVITRN